VEQAPNWLMIVMIIGDGYEAVVVMMVKIIITIAMIIIGDDDGTDGGVDCFDYVDVDNGVDNDSNWGSSFMMVIDGGFDSSYDGAMMVMINYYDGDDSTQWWC
jgi:hypothetical protein